MARKALVTKMTRDGEDITVTEFPDRYTVSNRHGAVIASGPTGDGRGAVGEIIERGNDGWTETSSGHSNPPYGTV